jgi:hypothetical protein
MVYSQMAESIRNTYGDCCLCDSYVEPNCRIDVSGLKDSELAAIHGDHNQRCPNHGVDSRLCDRLIFGRLNGDFICAAELKGGGNPEVPKAISQIQGGLDLARSILQNRTVDKWYPLLFFRGRMRGNDLRAIQTRTVSYGGKRKLIDRIDCGSSLLNYLNRQ